MQVSIEGRHWAGYFLTGYSGSVCPQLQQGSLQIQGFHGSWYHRNSVLLSKNVASLIMSVCVLLLEFLKGHGPLNIFYNVCQHVVYLSVFSGMISVESPAYYLCVYTLRHPPFLLLFKHGFGLVWISV